MRDFYDVYTLTVRYEKRVDAAVLTLLLLSDKVSFVQEPIWLPGNRPHFPNDLLRLMVLGLY